MDTKTRTKKEKRPPYRRIKKYYKSTQQYWKERNRRKEIRELRTVQCLSQKDIATKLGVSVSTVKRDLKKVERYIRGQLNRTLRAMQEERDVARKKAVDGLSLFEQVEYLSREWENYQKLWKQRQYNRHVFKFFIDLDHIQYDGFPRIKMWPRYSRDIKLPYIFKFICIKDGEEHEMPSYITIDRVHQRRW